MTKSEQRFDFLCMVTEMVAWVLPELGVRGAHMYVNEWNRDPETQKRYVAEGVSATLNSKHLDKLAVDFAVILNNKYQQGGPIYDMMGWWWMNHGGRWGGEWTKPYDPYHFEYNKKRRDAWKAQGS